MILYSPIDGDALTSHLVYKPRHCFLITRLGQPIPKEVAEMRSAITEICQKRDFTVVDASTDITGRDYLLKIWKAIAASPLAVGIYHEKIPKKTDANIFYELGVAQALGKETVIVKSPGAAVPSDFVRTEYIKFDNGFDVHFATYLDQLMEQAEHYEMMSDQLENNPVLSIDYLKRAFLISGEERLREKVHQLLSDSGLHQRARSSVELLSANF